MERIIKLADNVTLYEKKDDVFVPYKGIVEKIGLRGKFHMLINRENGDVEEREHENLIVDAGFDLICDTLGTNTQPSDLTHMAVGSNNTSPNASDTALNTILDVRRIAAYAHTPGTKVFTMITTFAAGESTGAWVEAGLFNAVTTGEMLNRVIFSVVNKASGDSITATFTITLS